jgi:hypothetical protein
MISHNVVVGYTHDTYAPAIWHGIHGWRFQEDFHISLGKGIGYDTHTVHYTGPDGDYLETFATRDDSAGHTSTHVSYTGSLIQCRATRISIVGGRPAIQVHPVQITLKPGVRLAPETPYELPPASVKRGKVVSQWSLDLDQLQIHEQKATVGAPELLNLPSRHGVKAWKIRVHTMGDPADYYIWTTARGEGLKVEMPIEAGQLFGILTPYHQPQSGAESAAAWRLGNPISLQATGITVRKPSLVNALDLSITGLPANCSLPSDGCQTVISTGPGAVHVSVATPGSPTPGPMTTFASMLGMKAANAETAPLEVELPPIGHSPLPAEQQAALLASDGRISAGAAIAALSHAMIHGATSDVGRCKLIDEWLYTHLKLEAGMPPDRDASIILRSRSAGPDDYAIAFAALARAAGVPTRVCAGIVLDGGRFYLHTWDESWVGNGWLPIDSSRRGIFVDATHVKLAEGGAEASAQALALLKSLTQAVLRVEWVQPEAAR